jgi:tRNA A-37 threonylcarbamoyl transferase component Bud32
VSWSVLQAAHRQPSLPFEIVLGGESLLVEQWLRTLPGKRYVGKAQYRGQPVLAKLYVGAKATAKAADEVRGNELLLQANLPTPQIVCHGSDSEGAWVLSEWLDSAETLQDMAALSVEGVSAYTECPEPVNQVAALIGQMHAQNLIQNDLHPGNFICSGESWWIVDAADVIKAESAESVTRNLGVFLAQLPERWSENVLDGLALTAKQCSEVLELSRQWRSWRALDLAKKSLRDCTLFEVNQGVRGFFSCWRDRKLPSLEWDGLLRAGELLKDGGSATVGLIEYRQQKLVIKRYNLKNWRHWLKRFWRPTRAWHSWFVGHRLRVLGVPTPLPVAMAEERFGPLRGRGFLLTEQAPGRDILEACQDESSTRLVAAQIRVMLDIFIRERISHGDFKGTNLLWDGQLHLIDLDAVQWHGDINRWQKAFKKDLDRLLRNWPEGSVQYQVMSEMIEELHY